MSEYTTTVARAADALGRLRQRTADRVVGDYDVGRPTA